MKKEYRIDGTTYSLGEAVWLYAILAMQLILVAALVILWGVIQVMVIEVAGWGAWGLFIVFQMLCGVALWAVGQG